jgi:hypothetical protein
MCVVIGFDEIQIALYIAASSLTPANAYSMSPQLQS